MNIVRTLEVILVFFGRFVFHIFISNVELFKCARCPEGSGDNDIYPKCNCEKVGQYNKYLNECTKCVEGSTGIYPNCTCHEENMVYNEGQNACVTCPVGASGKIPNCTCDNGAGL